MSFNRRNFLRSAGLSVAATFTESGMAGAEELVREEALPSVLSDVPHEPVTLVNLLQGTDSTHSFSRGNTLPIAAMPFGMAHWTLQTVANTPWMFVPGDRRIQGLSVDASAESMAWRLWAGFLSSVLRRACL